MLPPSLFAPLIILVASTVTVSAAPGLTVKTSTPNVEVDGLENLKVTTTVINTGGETLKLLNDPRGVLNSFPENTFTITDAAGSRPLFDGAKVHYPSRFLANVCAYAFEPASRFSTTPHTLLASTIPVFSPFSFLALQLV